MKKILFLSLIGCILISCQAETTSDTTTNEDSAISSSLSDQSYAIGYDIGSSIKGQDIDFDDREFKKGVSDGLKQKNRFTDEELQEHLMQFRITMIQQQQERNKKLLSKNTEEGELFLTENALRTGVVTLDSGLQYEVIDEGYGISPSAEDEVVVHYKGELIDGTVFDSSYDRGEPAKFFVNQVVPGWVEALQLMPEGSKWKLYIPSDLGYGERGAGQAIGPNAVLIFEVELLEVI